MIHKLSAAPLTDFLIRQNLMQRLQNRYLNDPATLILNEMGIRHGAVRADVVVINGRLHGYELKSDVDTLKRLPSQMQEYCAVFERMTLILAGKHLEKALDIVPEWWGIEVAYKNESGE